MLTSNRHAQNEKILLLHKGYMWGVQHPGLEAETAPIKICINALFPDSVLGTLRWTPKNAVGYIHFLPALPLQS